MNSDFSEVRVCVFDAYGTLFDVHSAVGRHRDRLGDQADAVSALWRNRQLEYTWLRTLMGRHADFAQVTADALDYALESHDIEDGALRDDLLAAYRTLDCYPEVRATLQRLRDADRPCAILSNGCPEMLEAALASAGLEGLIDACLSVEEVGMYKPAPAVYALATRHYGVAPAQVSFQSSNAWDAAGAASAGLRVVWVNRFGQRRERLPGDIASELRDLGGLPALLGVD